MRQPYQFERPYGDFTPLDALSLDAAINVFHQVKNGVTTPDRVCKHYRVNQKEYDAALARCRARAKERNEWELNRQEHNKRRAEAWQKRKTEPLSKEEEDLTKTDIINEWQDRPLPVRPYFPELPEGFLIPDEEGKKEKKSKGKPGPNPKPEVEGDEEEEDEGY